jgi:hypothetical protein
MSLGDIKKNTVQDARNRHLENRVWNGVDASILVRNKFGL